MGSVRLVQQGDGTYAWICAKCGTSNPQASSHLGFAVCTGCHQTSFIKEVVRDGVE